jgi:hypothetical protein
MSEIQGIDGVSGALASDPTASWRRSDYVIPAQAGIQQAFESAQSGFPRSRE